MKKLIVFIALWVCVFSILPMINFIVSVPASEAGVSQLNGGNYEAHSTAVLSRLPSIVWWCILLVTAIVTVIAYNKEIVKMMTKVKKMIPFIAIIAVAFISGCRRPYDDPEFKTIKSNETAFMIQAMGDSSKQDMFKSPEMLQKNMIAAKKVQIPHFWVQTGRRSWQGRWDDSVIFLIVNRSPVTRVWDADPAKGTSKSSESLTAESMDSLFVATGFTLTGFIEPSDAAKFLYKYQGDSLATVIDQQVKNSVQTIFTEECAKYSLLDLPKNKAAIMKSIRDQVIPFYKEWGITLSDDMGFVGGLKYSPEIQAEIDNVFKAEKAKERAVADKLAQVEINLKELAMAENAAKMKTVDADADAYAVTVKADAIKAAGSAYIQAQFIDKWDGIMPKVSSGNVMQMMDVESSIK